MTANDADTPRPAGPSWLERLARKRWARWLVVLLVLPTLALIALVLYLAHVFMEDEPVVYSKIEEHFKYGSTGGERESGFPYWIFQALPRVCALHLPGPGYASLGFTYEEGKDLPVGMSRRRYQGIEAKYVGTKYDTTQRAAGNQGHAFGTELSPADKDALIEYLKTL
jgi:hypothetical protein